MDKLTINGYVLENEEKVNRAIYGVVNKYGELEGGVGEDASDEIKLAAYDRIGGYITLKGEKVKNGAFCDFKESKKAKKPVPVAEPKPELEFRVNKQTIYVPVGEEKPREVEIAQLAEKQIKEKK